MKNLILLCICLGFNCANAQNFDYHPADWPLLNDLDFRFNNSVKEVESTTYSMNDKEEKTEAWKKDVLIFKNNLIHKWIQEDLQFKQNFTQVFNYTDGDVPKLKTREIYDGKNQLIDQAIYIYDQEHEDMISEIQIKEFAAHLADAPPIEYKIEIVLNEKGQRQKDIYYSSTGTVINQIKLIYYPNGLVASKQLYDRENNWLMTDSIVYNPMMRKTKDIVIYPHQKPDEDPVLVSMEYIHGKNGLIVGFKLDENNLVFEHKLDDQGNWVERRSYKLDESKRTPYQLIERKIIYEK